MKLVDALTLYMQLVQASGCSGASVGGVLRLFVKFVGSERDLDSISAQEVRAFLDGNRPLNQYWHRKYSALRVFFRFAAARGLVHKIPLPVTTPRVHQSFSPYVYSETDVGRLIEAIDGLRTTSMIEPRTLRTLVLLLYGTGLRLSEALQLHLADVDLQQDVITIREAKFYKTRLVPLGAHLAQILRDHVEIFHNSLDADPATPFLVRRDRRPPSSSGIRRAFARLRLKAGIRRDDDARYQPRLHDFRATFAVHRLTTWYRQGADVQRLLPLLSTYLGHASIAATQVYLPLIPELLIEASIRFERYAAPEELP